MKKSGQGYKFKKMFPDKWGSDYGVNTVRVSGIRVRGKDRVRGWVSGRISSRISSEGRST